MYGKHLLVAALSFVMGIPNSPDQTANAADGGNPAQAAFFGQVVRLIASHSDLTFNVTLPVGETSVIELVGDGDSDLDLFVYDENGNLVGSDEGPRDHALVQVRPRWTGPFRIVVRNLGDLANLFHLTVV